MDKQIIKEISENELLSETVQLKNEGYRLAAISCTNKNGMELSYSFDKDYDLFTLRVVIDADCNTEIESISCFYSYAFLYENEIKELFGVKIKNILLDFNNNLYKISVKTPFNQLTNSESLIDIPKNNIE
jgi:ech hydrogenase subunit D